MDIVAFSKLLKNAPIFCAQFEHKKSYLQAQLLYLTECEAHEKELVLIWIKASTKWIEENQAQYDKLKYIRALPTNDINELYEVFK